MNQEIDNAFKELYGMVFRLRIENEVNKVLIHALKHRVIMNDIDAMPQVLDHIEFTSEIIERQIKMQWSEDESVLFKNLIQQEIKKLQI